MGNECGIGIIQKSHWETELLSKLCGKIFVFSGTSYNVCDKILKYMHKELPDDIFFIQYDSQLSEPHIEIALENFGYHIGTQYYHWICNTANIDVKILDVSKKFDIRPASIDNAKEIKTLTEKFPEPGRFVADPFFKKEGKVLYSTWAYNYCLNLSSSKQVLACWINDRIVGYHTIKFISDKVANLSILRIDPKYANKLIGFSLVAESIKYCMERGIESIYTRTSKFNKQINIINRNLGYSIIESGIQFHWVNKCR